MLDMDSCWGDEAVGYVIPENVDTRTNTVLPVASDKKLTWGIPLERVVEIPEDGEVLVKYMDHCSNKMTIVAKEREKFKNEPTAVEYIQYLADQTRFWTKQRSTYAAYYLESDLAVSQDMRIREMQSELDAAKMAHDWEGYHYIRPVIENLRDERARFDKWSRDNKKLD